MTTRPPKVLFYVWLTAEKTFKHLKTDEQGFVISEKTCFYAEGGGQVGDNGRITTASGHAAVLDCVSKNGIYIHSVRVIEGVLEENQEAVLEVHSQQRQQVACNHSATSSTQCRLEKRF